MKETDHILTCDHLLLVFSLWEYLDRPQKGPGKVASVCPGRVGVLAVPFTPVSPAVSTRHSTNKHVLSEKANHDQLSLPGAWVPVRSPFPGASRPPRCICWPQKEGSASLPGLPWAPGDRASRAQPRPFFGDRHGISEPNMGSHGQLPTAFIATETGNHSYILACSGTFS